MNRRRLLKFGASFPFVLPLLGLKATEPLSLLKPTTDPTTGLDLLKLAPGFTYRSFGWTGDEMSTGVATPDRHDGMAVVPGRESGEVELLRNHERSVGAHFTSWAEDAYDRATVDYGTAEAAPGGGVTSVTLKNGKYAATTPILAGTMVNCAGGPTPWGTWLSCEEIVYRRSLEKSTNDHEPKDHGYVFEALPAHIGKSSHKPIKDMGLMRHEAAAIDPNTGYVYLTEDNNDLSGFYRFIPNDDSQKPGSLDRGGRLDMLKVNKEKVTNLIDAPFKSEYDVGWVEIDDPDADPQMFSPAYEGGPNAAGGGMSGPFLQGVAQQAARFSRGEGCWYHGGLIYFIDTAGGPTRNGSVWAYDPKNEKLTCCFASSSELMADAIDNITVNPVNGQIVVCEDGGGISNADNELISGARLLVLGTDNTARIIAENNVRIDKTLAQREAIQVNNYQSSEWAGATFALDGKTLYVNIQSPGITFAIEGPWLG